MKACAQRSWGRVKQSRAFQILLSLLAILPLVDIGTDYAFVIVSFAYANEESRTYKLQQTVVFSFFKLAEIEFMFFEFFTVFRKIESTSFTFLKLAKN